MHIGDIYKSPNADNFVLIQSYAMKINKDYENSDDILVVISPLMIVDDFVSSDPARCLVGTQKEIEDTYQIYLENGINTDVIKYNDILDNDIKPRIKMQNEKDEKEIEGLFAKMTDVDKEKLKEDIDKILKGESK